MPQRQLWPSVPPLEPEEVEHYEWLLDGLTRGLRERAALRGDEVAIRALETVYDLADELLARLAPPPIPAIELHEVMQLVDDLEVAS